MAWARTSIHVQEYGTRHQHDIHLTPYFLESVLEQSLQLIVSLTQPSRGGRGGGLPIVGFLNCGPTCKANSNARPQTDLRFAQILSVWVGQWGHVQAISRMRWPCAGRADASQPRTFFFANTYIFFIIDFLVHGNTSPKF